MLPTSTILFLKPRSDHICIIKNKTQKSKPRGKPYLSLPAIIHCCFTLSPPGSEIHFSHSKVFTSLPVSGSFGGRSLMRPIGNSTRFISSHAVDAGSVLLGL